MTQIRSKIVQMNRPESRALEPCYAPLANRRRELAAQELAVGTDVLEAMTRAGYRKPARPNARRLANSPDVRARVMAISLEAAELAGVHLGRILIEEARLAYSDVVNYFERDQETGKPRFGNVLEMRKEVTAAIAQLKFRDDGSIEEFKLHDKPGTLRSLRKRLEPAAPSKLEISGKDGGALTLAHLVGASYEEEAK